MEITGTDNYRPPTLIHPASPGEGSLSALCQASLACRVPSKVPIASAEMGFWPLTGTVRFYRCTPPFPASALQLLLQKPPTSPFTASPFDLVINPGQRANSPVRPWLHPTFGRARLRLARTRHKCWHWRRQEEQKKNGINGEATHRCGSHWKHGQPGPALEVPAWAAVALTSHLMLRPTG